MVYSYGWDGTSAHLERLIAEHEAARPRRSFWEWLSGKPRCEWPPHPIVIALQCSDAAIPMGQARQMDFAPRRRAALRISEVRAGA